MASNTENLNLLMKNPSTDGADTFNVQTMLNENWQKIDANAGTVAQTLANILKPTTPPIIGLPPSTTPDGMFQALGNTGELHVWRKTVTTAQEIPAGYTLGTPETVTFKKGGTSTLSFRYGASIGVSDDGKTVYINNASTGSWYGDDIVSGSSVMKGKFIQLYSDSAISNLDTQPVYFFPQSSTMECNTMSGRIYANVQLVTGYPLTPAGTTTTYPVSTDPNAYQEGSDAKAAGYVVGEVVTGSFQVKGKVNYPTRWHLSKTINVADDGTITVPGNVSNIGYTASEASFRGMFGMLEDANSNTIPFAPGVVVYFPTDVNITDLNIDRYQPVTGYAAIPAGTTIEYLGKLGDKARVQVLSYVGTGTYGSSNPNSLTFGFVPKVILIYRPPENYNDYYHICMFLFNGVNTGITLAYGTGFNNVTWNGKKVSWYSDGASENQMSVSGQKYYAAAIG